MTYERLTISLVTLSIPRESRERQGESTTKVSIEGKKAMCLFTWVIFFLNFPQESYSKDKLEIYRM